MKMKAEGRVGLHGQRWLGNELRKKTVENYSKWNNYEEGSKTNLKPRKQKEKEIQGISNKTEEENEEREKRNSRRFKLTMVQNKQESRWATRSCLLIHSHPSLICCLRPGRLACGFPCTHSFTRSLTHSLTPMGKRLLSFI